MSISFKQKLGNKDAVVGSWINTASPIVSELMALSGFDFLTIDVEHSAVDLPQAQILFQAIRSGCRSCAPLVRLKGNDFTETKRFLDAGAVGVIAPFINTAEQARRLVESVKYPPEGLRGVGFCRANQYGKNLEQSVRSANDDVFVCIQIEHIEAVENINQILNVPGIDALMIGPYDLSASMNITAQFDHPKMISAVDSVLAACKKTDVVPGIHVVKQDPDEAVKRISEGYRFIAYSLDIAMLSDACDRGLDRIKKKMGHRLNS